MIRPTGVVASGAVLRAMLGLPTGPPPELTGVTLDSRRVRTGDLYAALPGFTTHGARFAAMAESAGAAAILTDPSGAVLIDEQGGSGLPLLVVDDPRSVLGSVSAWLYGRPADQLRTTGITGTNGKTTTAYLLDAALRADGRRTGLIGTVATQVGDEVLPATRTTPEAPDVHALLAVMHQREVSAVTMEVSSHALELGRVDGLRFDLGVFTNLSQDHLDFHGDMQSYFEAKSELFTPQRSAAGLVCVDDQWGRSLAEMVGIPVTTYSLAGPSDWTARDIAPGPQGTTRFVAVGPEGEVAAGVGLPGQFNVANALAAIAGAVHHGVDPLVAATAVRDCPGVPGRMERVRSEQDLLAIVDYAHTPDAVARALVAARAACRGRVIVVMGCGGDRDRDKRPLMGEVAAGGADVVIITDDNPRAEEPSQIRAAIMEGARRVPAADRAVLHEDGDRRVAIERAVHLARPDDCVLVLGKGHEQGQEVAGVTTPFDDRLVVREALEELR